MLVLPSLLYPPTNLVPKSSSFVRSHSFLLSDELGVTSHLSSEKILQFLFLWKKSSLLQFTDFAESWVLEELLHCKAFSLNFFPTIHRFCRVFSVVEQELWLWVLQNPFFLWKCFPYYYSHIHLKDSPPKCANLWDFGESEVLGSSFSLWFVMGFGALLGSQREWGRGPLRAFQENQQLSHWWWPHS